MKNKCFEDYLYDQHAKQYLGLDDDMAEDWGEWVLELDVDRLIKYADAWMKESVDEFDKKLSGSCDGMTVESMMEAAARAYCSDKNKHKVLDSDLLVDICEEIHKELMSGAK